MCVHLRQRKNDQFRKGQQIIVCRSDRNDTCPVAAVENFLRAGKHKPEDPLFGRIISAPVTGDYLTGRMSDTRARELFLALIEKADISPEGFGLHSLRSGGATAAANAGVQDRLLQRHGGWKCSSSQNCYIQESLTDLMSVSRSILCVSSHCALFFTSVDCLSITDHHNLILALIFVFFLG